MDYQVRIHNIKEYKQFTGRDWPFSKKAFEVLNEFHEEGGHYIYRYADGTPSVEKWNEFNNLKDLVDYTVKHSCMHDFFKKQMFTNVPDVEDDNFFDYLWEFIDFAKEELHVTILYGDTKTYLAAVHLVETNNHS